MLAEILHRVAAMEAEERGEHIYRPRPSMSGPERCLRQMVYQARGEARKPLPGRAITVMEDSSWHEELTADLIRKGAFHVHSQQMPVSIPGAYPWRKDAWTCNVCSKQIPADECHGHIDFIVTDMIGMDVLVEHKALSHFGFEGLLKGELPLDYLTQKAIYLRGANLINPELYRGLLLVKNKNQSGYLEFLSEYDAATDTLTVLERVHHTGERMALGVQIQRITQSAFDKFQKVDQYVVRNELPPRPYDYDHWRCQYCGYTETCYASFGTEHAKLIEDVALDEEMATLIRYRQETAAQESEARKEKESLTDKIKDALKALGVRKGRAGEYIVDWQRGLQKRLDPEALDPIVRAAATVEKPYEKLVIRRLKEEIKP